MDSWLVTGGAGFIGTNFIRHAVSASAAKIVALDLLTYARNIANIGDLVDSRQIGFVKGDICDSDLLDNLFIEHQFNRVIHFAAESHVDRSILGPTEFLRTNIDGTFSLLQAARRHWKDNHSNQMFLHVSTDEVFGDLEPDDPPFTEATPYCPSSNKWDRCAVRLSECFAHHFHVMRRVVDSANDVPRWSFV